MRVLLPALVLLLAGCAQLLPQDQAPRPAEEAFGPAVRDGPWTMRVAPALLAGAPGEEVAFTVEIRHDGLPPPRAVIQPETMFIRMEGTPSRTVPIEGQATLARGRAVAGAVQTLGLQVLVPDETGAHRIYTLRGANVLGRENATVAHVEARLLDAPADVPPGLDAKLDGRRVEATFAGPEPAAAWCGERVEPKGDFLLVKEGNRTRLVGFVQRTLADACAPGEAGRSRVSALTPELPPGEVDVLVVQSTSCACPALREWERFEARLVVP